MKLANKISWVIFIVALICVSACFLTIYFTVKSTLKHEIEANLESAARSRANHIETYLGMLQTSIGQLSKSIVLENLLKTAGTENLRQTDEFAAALTRLCRTKEANPSIAEFLLLDQTGRVIVSSDEKSLGADKSADAIFLGGREKLSLKDVYYSKELEEPLIAVAAPMQDSRTGAFLGVLAARVELKELWNIAGERTGLGETGEIYLVNKSGFMITPTRFLKDTFLKQRVDTENIRRAQQHAGQEHGPHQAVDIFPDYRGVPVMGTHAYIPRMQWHVLAEMDAREAFAPLAALFRRFLVLLFAIPIIAWLSGLFVARIITRALARLRQGAEIIGSGNLDYKVGTGARDEVGQLAQAFDKMAGNLKNTMTSVENLNREITARKQTEEDLVITLRSIGDALITTDLEGRITRMNPVAEKLTGWRFADAAGQPLEQVFRIINSQTRQPAADPAGLVLKKGKVVGLANHTALIARDGTEYQIADSAAPIRNAAGLLRGVVLVFHDITAEHQVREALRESEARFKALITGAGEGIIVADLETKKFRFVNPAACRQFGYTEPEFRQLGVTDIHPGQSLDYVISEFEAQASGAKILAAELPCLRKDGSVFYADVNATPIVLEGHRCVAGFFTDTTERRQTAEKIQRAKEDWESTFDSMTDSICLIDEKYIITRVNRAMSAFLGIKPEKAVGQRCYACVHNTEEPPAFCPHFHLLQDGREHHAEVMDKKRNKWLYITVSPLKNKAGQLVGAVHVMRDITESKKTALALQQANTNLENTYQELQKSFEKASKLALAAQAASVAKGRFAANISHEIRTPLNGIIGICELLLGTKMNEEQREYAQLINSSAESLLNIINATLDFSKIDAGKMELEYINFNLRTIFEDIIGILAVNAAQKKLELIGFIEPSTPLNLNGDPGRLRQILFNLIGNAIKFTAEGEITVKVAPLEEKEDRVYLRFTVCDTGIGIPPNKLDQIFDAFTQGDDSFSRKFGGTGLGLAISKGLTEQMWGRIGVERNPDKGSTFWFMVPFIKQKTVTTGSFEPDVFFGGQRILIVDDNTTNRTILAVQLQSWGAVTDTAESGARALEKLRLAEEQDQAPFAAVIVDQRMPEMDGLVLAQNIKTDPALQNIPLILMSSMILPPQLHEEHKHLFAGIILKPIRQTHLYYSLLTALSGEKNEPWAEIKGPAPEGMTSTPGLRILVAEDNATNQKVICSLLKKMGHAAIAVANGQEALRALEMVPYDLVLMDVQMPEMDGFKATALIRDPNTRVLNHQVPIIALTAHAMEGDREKCLAAGMNGYIPKPVTTKALAEALADQITLRGIKTISKEKEGFGEPGPVVFNERSFAERLMNDRELMIETIRIFLEDMSKRVRELTQKIRERNQEPALQIAHMIKGSAANVSGQKLQAVAARIETACQEGDWRQAETLAPRMEDQLELLEKAMQKFSKAMN